MPGVFIDFEEPVSLEQGQKYYLRNQVRNTGSEVETFRQRYVLRWLGQEAVSAPIDLPPNEVGMFVLIGGVMPAQDAVFDIYLERGPLWTQDDYHFTTVMLGIGQPQVIIESTQYPEFQYYGSRVEMAISVKNVGATSAYTAMHVQWLWNNEEITTMWIVLDPEQTTQGEVTFSMPNEDATVTISLLKNYNSEWIIDDSVTLTVRKEDIPSPPDVDGGMPLTTLIIPVIIVGVLITANIRSPKRK